MIGFDLWTEIHARARRGEAKQKMARELGLDRKTVRRLLAQERPVPYQRTMTRPALVTPYLDYIQRRVTEVDYNAYRLFQELKGQGYAGGYEMVKLAVRPLRAERDRLAQATLRFETAPGRQAQVDWGSTWAQIGAQRVRVQLFVMVLGYSRRLYVECTRDQTLGSLLTCHQHAFDWFGGLTEEILYDNAKTVVLKRDWEGRVLEWHPQLWDFAQYYGFTPRLCRP
jgi:transposase